LRSAAEETEIPDAGWTGHAPAAELDLSADAITYAIDAAGVVRGWSSAAEQLFGFTAEEIVGHSALRVTPRVAPEPTATAVTTDARRADGSAIPVALTIAPTANGLLACRAHEVADSRAPHVLKADLALRAFARDAIVTTDRAGQVIELNPAAERLFDVTRDAALGRPLAELLQDPELPERVLTGEDVHEERRHGELTLAVDAIPLRDATGAIAGAAISIADVTATRVVAAARERKERDARLLERASTHLTESLDPQKTLNRAVEAFIPELAEVCVIYSLEPGPSLKVRSAVAADPELADATARIVGEERPVYPIVEELLSGARPHLLGQMTADDVRHATSTAGQADQSSRLGPSWRTMLPLRSPHGVWGIVVLFTRLERPQPTRSDLRLMQQLAERAGQALLNARLHTRFTAAFAQAPIGMALIDGEGVVTEANPALAAITGRTQLVGRPLTELYHPQEHAAGERRFLRADGQAVWVQTRVARLDEHETVLLVEDITDRKRYEGELEYLADHDPLTGLFNRRRFAEELDWVLAYSRRYRSPAALVAIDVDNFKFVNDTFGHATGDELLVAIAHGLRARCRDSDVVGRVGGDEFGVILPQSGREEADVVAQALLDAVRDVRVMVGRRAVRATASIGVRLIVEDTEQTAEEILSDADIALYDAKESGRDRLSVAGEANEVTDRLRARLSWSERIRDALASDGFELYEQPILHIGSGRVAASELLLRMRDGAGGTIAPGEFLDAAERFGQIQAIDRWVIGRAVRVLAERQAKGLAIDMEVNLSGGSISDPTVIDFIASEVRNAPIDPRRLTIEVTETAAITNIERARQLARTLTDLGCRFALDDFGSGFGSFYYLKHLPFDLVKIDGEFIKELEQSKPDRLTVQAIVQIAKGLDKPTVAEFVESLPILRELERLGVDFAQGYHIGRPRPLRIDPGFDG
jgi:diguanylate cyclase (GGDEF)-like protein/PAS domain S-box-containing protein